LGERIRKWRSEQGLFQKELARILGVDEMDEMAVVNLEKERTKPTKRNLEKFTEWFGDLQLGPSSDGFEPPTR
jgi:transcriptional regulator with XRE-family HTH domain